MPCRARNVFSRIRCCAIASACPFGLTIACASAAAAAAAGTFSNSKVTTATRLANSRTASMSSYGALISTSAICPVGVSSSGASVCTRYPRRRAAIANMRPSWPPPSTPIVDPGRMLRIFAIADFRFQIADFRLNFRLDEQALEVSIYNSI